MIAAFSQPAKYSSHPQNQTPMKFQLIDDFHNFFRFWSTRLHSISAACVTAAAIYAYFSGLAPELVAGIPQTILTGLVLVAMFFGAAGIVARGIKQPNLYQDAKVPNDPFEAPANTDSTSQQTPGQNSEG